MPEPPRIDSRHAIDIDRETRELLLRSLREDPEWTDNAYEQVESKGSLAAMIGVFARFAETIIDRINRSPHKNFLAFLDLIGVSRRHPQPARVPLTFGLAAGTTQSAIVKAGTQAAAQPGKDDTQPVIFETERELVVSPAKVVAAYMMDHGRDRYYLWLPLVAPDVLDLQEEPVPVEHALYLGLGGALDAKTDTELELKVGLEKPVPGTRVIEWSILTANGWVVLQPLADETAGLSRSGVIRFLAPDVEPAAVNGVLDRWMRAALKTPIEGNLALPSICSIAIQVGGGKTALLPANAFAEFQPLDLTRDFFPFGARPGFGSTFYITNPEAFSMADAEITLHVDLTNPATGGPEPPIRRTTISGRPKLAWELWNGARWIIVGVSETGADKTDAFPGFEDTTRAFSKSGTVKFRPPEPGKPVAVNGVVLPWLRVRLISGDYGVESTPVPQTTQIEPPVQHGPVGPPAIHALTFDYRISRALGRPDRIFDFNDFKWNDDTAVTGCFQPFQSNKDLPLAVYFGFEPPPGRLHPFGTRSISLYLVTRDTPPSDDTTMPSVEWHYWKESEWKKWTVRDETEAITDPGPVRFLPPADFSRRLLFGRDIYWLRVMWTAAGPKGPPIQRILLNTVMAVNSETIENEILGSSNGMGGQVYRTLRVPVLDGPMIEVRERQRPLAAERARIEEEEGPDAIRIINEGPEPQVWVRWHEMPDFLESSPLDRHYVVDHITGDISFGDNMHGMIPPAGAGNIRAASYRTGGGVSGNRKPSQITSLKTTSPYIDRVCNYEPSEGGVDAEDESELPVRGPNVLRHRGRAVAREDYQDLAMLASPEVARAKCLAARDLRASRDGKVVQPGVVSVIIVPRSTDAKPIPSATLKDTVEDYLNERKVATAQLRIVAPDYVRVDVEVEIGIESLDSGDIELAAMLQLQSYLHPLTGGPHNTGWQFGRRVRASELYKVIEPIPGVRYVKRLEVRETEEPSEIEDRNEKQKRKGVIESNLFLIYSGAHTVRLFLAEK